MGKTKGEGSFTDLLLQLRFNLRSEWEPFHRAEQSSLTESTKSGESFSNDARPGSLQPNFFPVLFSSPLLRQVTGMAMLWLT